MRISDWSSDVCSSDLEAIGHHIAIGFAGGEARVREVLLVRRIGENLRLHHQRVAHAIDFLALAMARRVEEIARIHLQARLVRPEFEPAPRSEEHTSELQSLMRISYAVFCLKKKKKNKHKSNANT